MKYWVMVDKEKVDEFKSLTTLSKRQRENVAYDYAQSHGLREFGSCGVEVIPAQTAEDFK